jgi:molecular chaperone HscB
MDLKANDFELFGLPERFAQDGAAISQRWKALQRETHPDRFAAQGAAAQRVAAQYAARINEAHSRLKAPLARASYLCGLRGQAVEGGQSVAMSPAFLMQQMAWREALSEASNTQDLDQIGQSPAEMLDSLLSKIEQLLDGNAATDATTDATAQAAQAVREALFVEKFLRELDVAYEKMEA